jgi:hypothetical protein
MEPGTAIFLGLVAVAFVLWVLDLRAKSGPGRKGPQRHGDRRTQGDLGMEATNLASFNEAMRRNVPTNWGPKNLQGQGYVAPPPPIPMKDDETYAARYHDAFGKPETKT